MRQTGLGKLEWLEAADEAQTENESIQTEAK
jgi:hypothetical protein